MMVQLILNLIAFLIHILLILILDKSLVSLQLKVLKVGSKHDAFTLMPVELGSYMIKKVIILNTQYN